jgi:hypothetical protein
MMSGHALPSRQMRWRKRLRGGMGMITGEQLRAARAILRLEQTVLSKMAGVSVETIKRMEASTGVVRGRESTVNAIVGYLERCGVEFLSQIGDSGAGVRLASIDLSEQGRTDMTGPRRSPEIEMQAMSLRIPKQLKQALEAEAEESRRSLNSEIVERLRKTFSPEHAALKAKANLARLEQQQKKIAEEMERWRNTLKQGGLRGQLM